MKSARHGALVRTLEARFHANGHRHPGVSWTDVEARLRAAPDKLDILQRMEDTGGEPDVVWSQGRGGVVVFVDCAPESPEGRRSLCYDRKAWDARKQNKPAGNVLDTAGEIGVELLSEAEYRQLQDVGEFDRKTSSWIKTPAAIRALGGALFCDRRYGAVFVYHNGAESYYAARGFRGRIEI